MTLLYQVFGVLSILAGLFMFFFANEQYKIEFIPFTRLSLLFGIILIVAGIILLRL